jgi:hypothetical protein
MAGNVEEFALTFFDKVPTIRREVSKHPTTPKQEIPFVFLIRDWEGCTTGTIGLPNPNRRSVVKTTGFLILMYTGIPLGFTGTDPRHSRVKG